MTLTLCALLFFYDSLSLSLYSSLSLSFSPCHYVPITLLGFEFRISKQPESSKINAIFWTYPEQRFDLVTHGSIMFVDATHGTTHYDWPLFTPCVLNSDRKIRPIGYCLVDSECDLSQSWMLSVILEIEPTWLHVIQVIFTDDGYPGTYCSVVVLQ